MSADAAQPAARAGRRRGNPDTRATILAAAETEFAEKGFDRASVRGIAKVAGVDPALIYHYFRSKDDVLLASLDVPFDPREVISALTREGRAGLGDRIATRFLATWDEEANQTRLVAMVRASMSSRAAQDLLRNGLVAMILRPISEAIATPDAVLRSQYVASQLLGMVMARYVLRLARIGPTLQRYIEGAP
jgi:AcrR family transcriptional regulator